MKVYTTLLCFAQEDGQAVLLTAINNLTPLWIVMDEERETLDLVQQGLYNITGVDKVWYPEFVQAGAFEFWTESQKEIYIVYTVYFPSTFDIKYLLYKWTNLDELDETTNVYKIIRYLYARK